MRPRRQVCYKRYYGKCLLCDESRYEALECHRVVPGPEGGTYQDGNVVVLCANHHSLVTAGAIRILALRPSTFAQWVAQVIDEDGTERWVPLSPRIRNVHP
jgi:hypothetical protein